MHPRRTRRAVLSGLGAGAVGLAGCLESDENGGDGPPDADEIEPVESEYDLSVDHDLESWAGYDPNWAAPTDSPLEVDLEYETVVENLEVPWDLTFAPDGELFISERPGRILRFEAGEVEAVTEPADVIDRATAVEQGAHERDWWAAGGEGGLLGVAVHPAYPDVPLLYAFYTYEVGDEEFENRLVYFDVSADDPAATETTVLEGIEGDEVHNGSRIAFGPENYLWVTTGDANRNEWETDATDPVPQDLTSLAGKVLRLEPDGTVPEANPDLGDDADPRIYTYGHRNPQGIAWLPDGTPLVTEHGPDGRDEINRLEAGANHGWDEARDGETYEGTDYARPLVNTGPDASENWAPSGCVFYTGSAVPSLQRRLVVGALIGQHVNATTIYPAGEDGPPADGGRRFDADWMDDAYDAVAHPFFEDELGRVRHVEQGPDGALYAITSNRDGRSEGPWPTDDDDRLVRIVPAA